MHNTGQDKSLRVKRALISVFDKTGLDSLVRFLDSQGIKIISTGGTAKSVCAAGARATELSDLTGFPPILSGRVKTLHPLVHGGLLGIGDDRMHAGEMKTHGIEPFDLLIVNLYPFEDAALRGNRVECIENIDIGGPAMIRAAAKNHEYVCVVTDPSEYLLLTDELAAQDGCTSFAFRRRQAANAFARTASYDAAIADWMSRDLGDEHPTRTILAAELQKTLRYGENPHQLAALYRRTSDTGGIANAVQLQGGEPGYNNLTDADAALELTAEFNPEEFAACAIVKHGTPCGTAVAPSLERACQSAFDCDRLSAFGGIVACNRELDAATAAVISQTFVEVIVAPGASEGAREVLSSKPRTKLFACPLPDPSRETKLLKQVGGGLLVQDHDKVVPESSDLRTVTERQPTEAEIRDMLFAWKVAKHARSNAVVYAADGATVGIGSGQTSRVDAARMAARGMQVKRDMVAASDGFFPFQDGIEIAAASGATAIMQPGGSKRDGEVIAAADRLGIAMVFTGIRSFRH